jgi:hypothetical protein
MSTKNISENDSINIEFLSDTSTKEEENKTHSRYSTLLRGNIRMAGTRLKGKVALVTGNFCSFPISMYIQTVRICSAFFYWSFQRRSKYESSELVI